MSLLKNTSLYFTINLITKGVAFFVVPIYTTLLSSQDFGIKNAMATYGGIVLILTTLSVERSIYRIFWDYSDEEQQKKFLGTVFFSILLFACIAMVVIFGFSSQVQLIFKSIPFYPCFALVTAKIFVQSFFYIPKIVFQVKSNAKIYSILNLLEIFAEISGGLLYLYFFQGGIEGFFKGSLAGIILVSPLFFFFIFKMISFSFDKEMFKKIMNYSLPIIPSLMAAWALNFSDRIFIERFVSLSDVGVYSLGYQLGGAILIVTSSFFVAYNPYFFSRASSEDSLTVKRELAEINSMFTVLVTILGSVVCLFSQEIIRLFFSAKFFEAAYILSIVCIANIFFQISGLFNLSFHQSKKTKELFYVTLICSILNLALNAVLIPVYSITGAALSTLLSFIFMFFFTYKISLKYFSIPFDWKSFFKVLIVCTLPCYLISLIPIKQIFYSIGIKGLILIILCIIFRSEINNSFILKFKKMRI